MAVDEGPTTERIDDQAPGGGIVTVVHYLDDEGQPVAKERATRAELIDLDAAGNHVGRSYASLTPGGSAE